MAMGCHWCERVVAVCGSVWCLMAVVMVVVESVVVALGWGCMVMVDGDCDISGSSTGGDDGVWLLWRGGAEKRESVCVFE